MSYVIVNKETQQAVCEIYNSKLIQHLNIAKYEAIEIYKYLTDLNQKIKESNTNETELG